jgi:DNA (cytosine-5)-methyltransferase 1
MIRSHEVTAIFGGIGGLELGLHRHGHRTSLFCECDPEATAVLHQRFPETPITPDIRDTKEVLANVSPTSDLLTAGFPCTDLSQAGRTTGFAGGRSSLIRETLELLRRRSFPNVLIENVPNWRHLHGGEYMREVLTALEELGYRWAYRTIDALAFGVPQRRQRVFLFATREGDPREVLFHGHETPTATDRALHEVAHGFYWTEGNRGLGWGDDCVPTLKGGSTINIPSPPAILLPDLTLVTPHLNDAERLQGFPDGWTDAEFPVGSLEGKAFNKRRRWMLVGNAVNVEVSAWIGERLAYRMPYHGPIGTPMPVAARWPAAAWFDGETRFEVKLGTWPVARPRRHLAQFLRYPGSPLSTRATAGFYGRACRSPLGFKPGFKEAVKAHLDRMEAAARISAARRSEDGNLARAA